MGVGASKPCLRSAQRLRERPACSKWRMGAVRRIPSTLRAARSARRTSDRSCHAPLSAACRGASQMACIRWCCDRGERVCRWGRLATWAAATARCITSAFGALLVSTLEEGSNVVLLPSQAATFFSCRCGSDGADDVAWLMPAMNASSGSLRADLAPHRRHHHRLRCLPCMHPADHHRRHHACALRVRWPDSSSSHLRNNFRHLDDGVRCTGKPVARGHGA